MCYSRLLQKCFVLFFPDYRLITFQMMPYLILFYMFMVLFKVDLSMIRPLTWGKNSGHEVACWFHCWISWLSLILMNNHPIMIGLPFSSKLHWHSYSVFIATALFMKIGALTPSWSFFCLRFLGVSINLL